MLQEGWVQPSRRGVGVGDSRLGDLELGVGHEVFCKCKNLKMEKQEIHECVPFVSLV